jgi:hypothetical protein
MNTKLQCGYEDKCKSKNCFNCRRYLKLKVTKITLAEATCIDDFGVVDLLWWTTTKEKNHKKELEISQDIMRKLMRKIKWE